MYRELIDVLRRALRVKRRFSLHGPTLDTARLHLWEGGGTAAVPAEEVGADTASGWLWQNQQSLLFRGSSAYLRSAER